MGVRKGRARPAAFAVEATPDVPMPGPSAWPGARPAPGTERQPQTGRAETGLWPVQAESWPAQAEEPEWWPPGAEVRCGKLTARPVVVTGV